MGRYLRPCVSWLIAVLVSWTLASFALAAEAHRPLVCMQPTNLLIGERDPIQILLIEMQRQAVLLVAREEFGAFTADQTCGEAVPVDSSAYAEILDLKAVVRKPGLRQIVTVLSKASADDKKQQVELLLNVKQYTVQNMHRICLEGTQQLMSREIPAALEQFGLHKVLRTKIADQSSAAHIGQRLGEMNFFAQLEVLRRGHAALWQEPDSPELLSIVARAYANLGQLARCQYDGSGKVFEARSLLYAQRMLSKHPDLPESMWTRAYACALGGIHAQAIEDLQAAGRMAAGKSRPTWATAAELACHYDQRGLQALGDQNPEVREIARFLAFVSVENCGSPILIRKAAELALETSPACFRILDAACDEAGVGGIGALTDSAFLKMVSALHAEYPRMTDLPASVPPGPSETEQGPEVVKAVAHVAKAMTESAAPGEPSWAMLGNLIQQTNFLHVYRRSQFLAYLLSVPTDDFIAESSPLVENHPLRDLIQTCSDASRQSPVKRQQYVDRIQARFWSPKLCDLANVSDHVNPSGGRQEKTLTLFYRHLDNAAYDGEVMLMAPPWMGDFEWRRHRAGVLNCVSPYNAAGAAALVLSQLEDAGARLEEFQHRYPNSPALLHAIGQQHKAANRFALAADALQKRMAIAPDASVITDLADCRFAIKDDAGAVQALERLWGEDYEFLDVATARVRIAQYYVGSGMPQKALPYAEQAAQSGAAWAMRCAANCYEKLGHWEQAAALYQSIDERYGVMSMSYYCFCVRTGRGDRAAAAAVLRESLPQWLAVSDREQLASAASYEYLEGKRDDALAHLKQSAKTFGDSWAAVMAAVIYDARGETQERDQLLPKQPYGLWLRQGNFPSRVELTSLAKMFHAACAEGNNAGLDVDQVEGLIASAVPRDQANIRYMAGMFLLQHGHEEAGVKLLRECIAGSELHFTAVAMAAQELRQRKLIPPQAESPTPAAAGAGKTD